MTVPSGITMTGVGVQITWDDGRTCTYPYRYLRLQCACAACVEEMTGRALLNVSAVPEDIIAVEYIEVGKYALQFLWTDGHGTGIYPFAMLLRLAENDDAVICEAD
ncbi:MAG: DUF971 domain-containing protein [Dehalococcoidia bacterium]|jgi:DUF971 family protein|nr:DUF971 domain-containing protein [Dehalococcoidia bacterium]HIN14575.1 DUF971 domain-containing protein [Dehalococcoidia bacterium]|tara:strand:- start:865 stop:1182 length:318 start_codon:yes stop_codon:yes gene_type:complete